MIYMDVWWCRVSPWRWPSALKHMLALVDISYSFDGRLLQSYM